MQMKLRKLIQEFMLCFVVASALMIIFSTKTYASDYTYEAFSDGTVKITGYAGGASTITIPKQIDGKTVTTIGEEAISWHTELTSITIPDSVTIIENNAFYGCSGLTNIEIPGSVESIGDSAFNSCTGLTSISIPNGVNTIGAKVFEECTKLVSVEIGDSVTSIGEKAFFSCTSLKSVKLSNDLTAISNNMFNGCEALTNVVIKGNVTSIGEKAFYCCKAIESISLPSSVTNIGEDAFNTCWKLASVEILGNLTSIGINAFSDCNRLEDINLPGSLTSIGEWAFFNCSSLERLEVPDSVTSIGENAFNSCSSLTIYANSDSYAKTYANANNINFSEPCLHTSKTNVVSKASFSGNGSIKEKCQNCKKTFSTQVINKIESATLSATTFTYDGSSKEPTVTVKDSAGTELTLGTDYTVTYDNDTKSTGTHTAAVAFTGNYSGSKELNYDITCTHQFTNYVADNDATCIANGHETASCDSGCGETDTREIADSSLGHNYKETFNWSTDAKACAITFTCDREGCSEETDGHSYTKDCSVTSVVTRPATCALEGIESFTATYTEGEKTYTDAKEVTLAKPEHTFEWIIDKAASATEAGSQHEECKACGYKKTAVEIPIIAASKSQEITTAKIGKIKAKTLKKKSVIIKLNAKTNGNGALSYKVVKYPKGMKKYIKVGKTGVVTLKKKAKKGIYKISITAAANGEYVKTTKVVTITVK